MDQNGIKLSNTLMDSQYVPKWASRYMLKNFLEIRHECFNVKIYKNKLSPSFIKQLLQLLSYIRKSLNIKHEIINVFLLLSKKRKKIQVGETFKPDNINSGFSIKHTIYDPKAVHIVIYRMEDVFKVLIHEIIHYVGLDLHNVDNKVIRVIDEMIKKQYKSMASVALYVNEAFTEALALHYYCLTMKKDFKVEQQHSIIQTKKFLIVNGCNTLHDFKMKENYSEKSHPFAYILVKSALINCPFAMKFIIDSSDVMLDSGLLDIFNKAITNPIWIRRVNKTQVVIQTSYNMNLTHI